MEETSALPQAATAAAEPISTPELLTVALIGGLILSLANFFQNHNRPAAKRVPLDYVYWLAFIAWPLIGAFVTWVYVLDGAKLRAFSALLTGLGAPTTIQTLIERLSTHKGPPDNAEP